MQMEFWDKPTIRTILAELNNQKERSKFSHCVCTKRGRTKT